MKKIIYTLIFFCLLVTNAVAQKAIGQWNTYLSYYSTNLVAEGNNHVFGVANGSLYSYNKEDNSISYYSKQTGLSDNDINNVALLFKISKILGGIYDRHWGTQAESACRAVKNRSFGKL